MPDHFSATDPDKAYFITSTIVDWIDVFDYISIRNIIIDSLRYCQTNKGLEIYAWCLMSNHLHMLCGSSTDSSLSNIMRDFKTFTSKAISREIEEGPIAQKETILNKFKRAASGTKKNQVLKVWQNGFHPKELRTNKFIYQKLRYIHMNPVKKGLVDFPEEYEFSSGSYYAGNGGLLDVIVLSPNFRQ